ncbi:MAG TPA: hypothetical protein VJ951_00395 [Bacteroidales bacterium]|nr:hypothetical protein [Bacteroidales bacterium]
MAFYNPGTVVYAYFPFEENPARVKPRPTEIIAIESDREYRVLKITSTDRSKKIKGDWILDTSDRGRKMGLRNPSFLDKSKTFIIDKALIIEKRSPMGDDPEIDSVIEDLDQD